MKLQPSLRPLAIALFALLGTAGAQAAAVNFSSAVNDAAKVDLKALYKTERDTCTPMQGNAKDICVETAKAHESVAMAQLEFNRTGTPKDEAKLLEARYKANYDVSKEKCDDLSGNDKKVCVQQAKTLRDKAKANLKQARKVEDAVEDAAAATMKADYALARTKCDALADEPKDVCVASSKARYNQRW